MARNPGDLTVTVSVLDRLLDNEPESRAEVPLGRAQSVRLLKNAVRRDLEWLLNTRRIFQEPSPELKEVNRSVYMFGLPDLSTFSMGSSTDQAKLVRQLLSTIKLFEPRLTDVRIVPVENSATGIQEFRFRIEAMLRMDPSPEPISFDSVIELKSGNCRLSGTAYA